MQALILAGGSGTRFWPASRRRRPKQLLPLFGDRTLLRLTLDRLLPSVDPGAVWVATGRELGDQVRAELPEVPREQILLEIPINLVCKPGCKGLCSVCGANKNEGDCGHVEDDIDPRLANLRSLLNDS